MQCATVLQLNYSAQCNGWSWGNSYHSRRQSDRHYHRHCPQPLSLASSRFSSFYWWEQDTTVIWLRIQATTHQLVDWFQNQSKCDNLESTLFGNPVYLKEILSLFGHLLNAGTTCGFSFQCNILLELAQIFSNVNWNTNFYTFLGDFQGNFFSATYFWSSPSCRDFLQRNVEIILHTAQTTFALAWLVQGEYNGGRLVGRLHNFPII